MASAEMEMKANLADLSKIPPKEFEKHFREWMDRDEVARGLQAKLRTDLITTFNKTALGRQILSQTTTTTAGGFNKRLTLSPLILALNTLVAEFLYAQNCHFSLSVFCTEVPYRNTIPDFESAQYFRFTEDEIMDILAAVMGRTKCERHVKEHLAKTYINSRSVSLLLLFVRALLKQMEDTEKRITAIKSNAVTQATQTTPPEEPQKITLCQDTQTLTSPRKSNVHDSNIRYLNKYLMALSKRVKEMSEQFDELHNKRCQLPRPRAVKSVSTRRYEHLNRSLEMIEKQLQRMMSTKRRSKQVGAVVTAVDSLASQFNKCAANFESVSRELISANQKKDDFHSIEVQTNTPSHRQAGVQVCVPSTEEEMRSKKIEKPYIEWVHEMRHSKNGQKFLNRIEDALRKALNRHRDLLKNESELKLRHQKELLKIHYKQKLMDHLARQVPYDFSDEARRLNESIGEQLRRFEDRHAALLEKITTARSESAKADANIEEVLITENVTPKQKPQTYSHIESRYMKNLTRKEGPKSVTINTKTVEATSSTNKARLGSLKNSVNAQNELKKLASNSLQEEHNVDNIIHDAKLRISELENESNQLEENFRNYLQRQRVQTDTMREVVASLTEKCGESHSKTAEKYTTFLKNFQPTIDVKKQEYRRQREIKECDAIPIKTLDSYSHLFDQENKNPNFKFRNAIRDAKDKLFKGENPRLYTLKTSTENYSICNMEPFYYNQNFGKLESRSNIFHNKVNGKEITSKVDEKESSITVSSVESSEFHTSCSNTSSINFVNRVANDDAVSSNSSADDFDTPVHSLSEIMEQTSTKLTKQVLISEEEAKMLKTNKVMAKVTIVEGLPMPSAMTKPEAAPEPIGIVILASTSAEAAAGIVGASRGKVNSNVGGAIKYTAEVACETADMVGNNNEEGEKKSSNKKGNNSNSIGTNTESSSIGEVKTKSKDTPHQPAKSRQGSAQQTQTPLSVRQKPKVNEQRGSNVPSSKVPVPSTSLTINKTMHRMGKIFERSVSTTAPVSKEKSDRSSSSSTTSSSCQRFHSFTSKDNAMPHRQRVSGGTSDKPSQPIRPQMSSAPSRKTPSPTKPSKNSQFPGPQRGSPLLSSRRANSTTTKPPLGSRYSPNKQIIKPTIKPIPKKRPRQTQLNTFTTANQTIERDPMKKIKQELSTNYNIVASEATIAVDESTNAEATNLVRNTETMPETYRVALGPTISSTTFNYDDAVSASSIEIAAMEPSDEQISLEELVEEEDDDEVDEDHSSFGEMQKEEIETAVAKQISSNESLYREVGSHMSMPVIGNRDTSNERQNYANCHIEDEDDDFWN